MLNKCGALACIPIFHFRSEKGTGAEMYPASVPGIVTENAPVCYSPIFSQSLETVPEVFAKVNSSQFPSRGFVSRVQTSRQVRFLN